MKRFLRPAALTAALAAVALGSIVASAAAESDDGYLHNIASPPRCAFPWQTPDPTLAICSVHFFAPRLASESQDVLLAIDDFEASQADCATHTTAQTTTFTVDGVQVPVTHQPCRFVPQTVDNVITLPAAGADTVWGEEYRYLIPAGSLAPGVHTLTWTSTFTSDWSYSLACTDPSGRCTVPAGAFDTATTTLTIVP